VNLSSRFRHWYEHERYANAKTLEMLQSVPEANQSRPEFHKAVGKMAHLVAARKRWLYRLGHPLPGEMPPPFPPGVTLADLPKQVQETEAAWVKYLDQLDERELAREIEFDVPEGKMSWDVASGLTQVSGHAWYHRGQIATLVDMLGGKPVDTDYIVWCKTGRVTPKK